ncbi:MAG: hypothetical protein CL816_03315 [Coxiellaceae bacterium]|nr:hypothetical protein [Coxiellaceae bacterium]|tara:strand:+ start:7738 stop:8946 length:1209 start_codon:yes stop_codon:yes gene_type:complete
MPLNNPAPQFGLLTAYDLRDLSATQLFTRGGGSAVSLPTFTTGQGVYEDGLFFLNGRSSDTEISAAGQVNTVKTFGTTWTVTIDSNDKVKITADADFEISTSGSNDALGIGSSAINATQVGSVYVVTAPNNWTRGSINLADVSYRIDPVGGGSHFNFPAINVHVQDVPTFIRDRATVNDADVFGLDSLEKLDQTAQSADAITWFINDDGYSVCSYLTSLGHITWSSTTMRDMLGFTGNETPVTYDTTYSLLTSTHKASGVLIPSRPYQGHHLRVQNLSESRRKISGGYSSNYIGTYVTSVLSFDLDALLDLVDDYQHFIHRWLTHCSSGERVNFYQGWGDSRRSLRTDQIVGTQSAYDSLYTSEDNGEYGRIRGSLVTADFNLAYPGRLKRRVPVSMEIEHL